MAREFLPRDFFDLPAGDDDEAIVGRGPNILLRDRARLLARPRLSQPVGREQPNRPEDVAQVETFLRATGDLDSSRDHDPIGYFSSYLDDATRRFQRRRGLEVDGIVNPDGETFQSLLDGISEELPGAPELDPHKSAECRAIQARINDTLLAIAERELKIDRLNAERRDIASLIEDEKGPLDFLLGESDLVRRLRPALERLDREIEQVNGEIELLGERARGLKADLQECQGKEFDI
jgi:hypothetical protein